jgi:hypothetical protein
LAARVVTTRGRRPRSKERLESGKPRLDLCETHLEALLQDLCFRLDGPLFRAGDSRATARATTATTAPMMAAPATITPAAMSRPAVVTGTWSP